MTGAARAALWWLVLGATVHDAAITESAPTLQETTAPMSHDAKPTPKPPIAPAQPYELFAHGETRVDPYYWLRDDARSNPQVLDYLRAENAYTEASLAPHAALREALYQDLFSRLKPDDATVPVFDSGYWYYARYEAGREYAVHARRKGTLEAREEILLDENVEAASHEFYEVGAIAVSDNGRLLAYTQDTRARGEYDLHVREIATGKSVLVPRIEQLEADLAWAADNQTLFFVRREEETLRPHRVFRIRLDQPVTPPALVYEEPDSTFYLTIGRTRDERYLQIDLTSTLTTEVRLLDAHTPDGTPVPLLPRQAGHEYVVETAGDAVYLLSNGDAPNFRLYRTDVVNADKRQNWELLVPEREEVLLTDFAVFDHAVVLGETESGIGRLRVLPRGEDDVPRLDTGYLIAASEPAYVASIDDNPDPSSSSLRYSYSSLATPETIFELDLLSGERRVLKQDYAGPTFDRERYAVERFTVTARDDAQVPVTLLRRRDMEPDGSQPLYLTGYGAYGIDSEPDFALRMLPLVDRGFVFAIAHIRGGQELGRAWYEHGRMQHKLNTFTDFIDVAQALVEQGWSAPDGLVGSGRSAGGLLIGAVANMAPKRFRALIAGVPFVDVLTTMLDESIPLTTFEYDEWGNPNEPGDYAYMRQYSPYDRVSDQAYPAMLVTSGLQDPAVQYWEPAKWVARLRTTKTDTHPLLLYTDMEAGHRGSAARYQRLRDYALEYAFLIGVVGLGSPAPK
ncbi:MAG: S9 family peptidase [Pseudomonadota bacterium]